MSTAAEPVPRLGVGKRVSYKIIPYDGWDEQNQQVTGNPGPSVSGQAIRRGLRRPRGEIEADARRGRVRTVRIRDSGNSDANFGHHDGASSKPVAHAVEPESGRGGEPGDGTGQTYPVTFQNPPELFFGQGGANIADPGGSISGQYARRVRAANKTASGFDLEAYFEELVGATTAHQASFSDGHTTGPPWQANNDEGEAWNDEYTYKYSVTVNADSHVTVEFWANDGGGWELVESRGYLNEDPDNPETHPAETRTIVHDDLFIDASTNEFGMDLDDSGPLGGGSLNPDEVEWETADEPERETMTPSGTPDIPWIAVGR